MSADGYVSVPAHPRLRMQTHSWGERLVALRYIGDATDLIAAGVATAEMLAPLQKKGPRPRGPNGERYSVDRYYVVRNGQPIRRCRLILWKVLNDAMGLPGALDALAAHEACERAAVAQEAERVHRELTAALAREREWEAAEPSDQVPADRAHAGSVTLH
jgi:hypothetical protein